MGKILLKFQKTNLEQKFGRKFLKNKNLRKKFREQKFESKIIRCKNLRLNLEDKYNLGTNLSENF